MDYLFEEIAFLAPARQHDKFGVCLSVSVAVRLQFDRGRGYAEDVRDSALLEETSEH